MSAPNTRPARSSVVRSGTQAVAEKASTLPTDADNKPTAVIPVDDMVKHTVACAAANVSSTFTLAVSGACAYVLWHLKEGKREDMEAKLRKLVSQVGVKTTQTWNILTTSARLASKIASTGKSALPQSKAFMAIIQTAKTPEDAVAELGNAIKTDCKIMGQPCDSFNRLQILVGQDTVYDQQRQAADAKAASPAGKASRKSKSTRQADAKAVERMTVTKPALLDRALMAVASNDDDTIARNAILTGIKAMRNRATIEAIAAACAARLRELNGEKPQQPQQQQAA